MFFLYLGIDEYENDDNNEFEGNNIWKLRNKNGFNYFRVGNHVKCIL